MDHSADKPVPEDGEPATNASEPAETGSSELVAKAPTAASASAEAKAAEAAPSALVPFLEVPETREAPPTPKHSARFDRLLSYSAHAALIVGLIGFAWAVSSHFFGSHPAASQQAKAPDEQAMALAKDSTERAELRRTTQAMAADIRALKTSLDTLRASSAHTPTAEEVKSLEKALDGLKGKLDTAKSETTASFAQLSGKVDRAQQEPVAKLRELAERLERIEKQTAAPTTTASIPAPAVATVNPTKVRLAALKPTPVPPPVDPVTDAAKKPQLITSWVLRDVYDGIALVEGAQGAIEVVPGETIPGAGTVRSIERRGAGWIVVTSRGLVDYARD
jgi:hypothetical protein